MKFQKITIDFGGLLGYIVKNEDGYEGWIDGHEETIYVSRYSTATYSALSELIEELEQTAWFYLNSDSFTE